MAGLQFTPGAAAGELENNRQQALELYNHQVDRPLGDARPIPPCRVSAAWYATVLEQVRQWSEKSPGRRRRLRPGFATGGRCRFRPCSQPVASDSGTLEDRQAWLFHALCHLGGVIKFDQIQLG